jgi:glucan 1,3-beta-glucosidase
MTSEDILLLWIWLAGRIWRSTASFCCCLSTFGVQFHSHDQQSIMGLLDSVKSKVRSKASEAIPSQLNRSSHSSPPLCADDIFRYRKQRGVNLGSWFVLEKWITPEPFKNAVGSKGADLDIANGNDAKAILEHHWDTWITDDDWKWIKDRGFNSVRLPVSS